MIFRNKQFMSKHTFHIQKSISILASIGLTTHAHKWVCDIYQYKKLSNCCYSRFQIIVMYLHLGLFWSAGYVNVYYTEHAENLAISFSLSCSPSKQSNVNTSVQPSISYPGKNRVFSLFYSFVSTKTSLPYDAPVEEYLVDEAFHWTCSTPDVLLFFGVCFYFFIIFFFWGGSMYTLSQCVTSVVIFFTDMSEFHCAQCNKRKYSCIPDWKQSGIKWHR